MSTVTRTTTVQPVSATQATTSLTPERRTSIANVLTHLTLIVVCIIMLFPVFWVVSTSFKTQGEIESSRITLLPENFTQENYDHILNGMVGTVTVVGEGRYQVNLFWAWVKNSLLVAGVTTVVGVLLAASTAYAFSRFQFRGRRVFLISFLVTQMFPGAILIVPLYNMLNEWGLLNNWLGLMLAYSTLALPFSVWMLKGFFDAIPYDLEEAAIVDGCSPFGAFWRIALPLTLPGIAVVAFFNFMTSWNEFMLALTFMTGEANKTLPVGLRNFVFQFNTDWHYMAAGSVLVTIPVMIGFLWAQRYLLSGLTAGGVKG
jgi:arabinogalactan oligomer/maltooligosaccharide transport system permease protein